MNISKYEPLGIGSGSRIAGRYELDRKVGAGGMSAVYSARDKSLNNELCALKILEPKLLADPSELERFRNEVQITRRLTHPNIIRTFEFGQTKAGLIFITMEFLDGESLHERIYNQHSRQRESNSPLSLGHITEILKSVVIALGHAHEQGIVHRDLKPGNILLGKNGEVKITDFGLAQNSDNYLRLTQQGECVGTPGYMSPEQLQGQVVDHRADIYSLGILAFEAAAHRLPFEAPDWYQLGKKVIEEPCPKLLDVGTRVPEWFETFIERCTKKSPDERFQNAQEVLVYLTQHMGGENTIRQRTNAAPLSEKVKVISTIASNNVHRYAPAMTIVAGVMMLFLILFDSYEGSLDNVEAKVENGQSALSDITNSLKELTDTAVKAHKNREKIRLFLEEKSSEEEAASAPVISPPQLPDVDLESEGSMLQDDEYSSLRSREINDEGTKRLDDIDPIDPIDGSERLVDIDQQEIPTDQQLEDIGSIDSQF
jgi:serine/threonine protein kinase